MPSSLIAWFRWLGLVSFDERGRCVLTDYGTYWYKKLPAKENIPRSLQPIVDVDVLALEEPETGVVGVLESCPF